MYGPTQSATAELAALDRGSTTASRGSREKRKLVTTDDALGYYADRYGLEVVGR